MIIIYIKCPFCGWTHIQEKKGTNALLQGKPITKIKGAFRFRDTDFTKGDDIFIDIREGGGRGSGFHRVEAKSLLETINSPEDYHKELLRQLKKQCENILVILKDI